MAGYSPVYKSIVNKIKANKFWYEKNLLRWPLCFLLIKGHMLATSKMVKKVIYRYNFLNLSYILFCLLNTLKIVLVNEKCYQG